MQIYYIIFLILSIAHFISKAKNNFNDFLFYALLLLLTVFVGLRDNVGGDWNSYFYMYYEYKDKVFLDILKDQQDDMAFAFINYLFSNFNFGFFSVNLITSLISFFGLYIFSKNFSDKFLILIIAFPVMIVICFMGFIRQGCALSISLIGIYYLIKDKKANYFFCIFFAFLFHKTAIIFLIYILTFIDFKNIKKKLAYFLSNKLLVFILILFLLLFLNYLDFFTKILLQYANQGKYVSKGLIPRLLMNLIPAIIFLFLIKKINLTLIEKKIIIITSLLIILSILFIPIMPTAVDRINLYFIFIQLLFFEKFKNYFLKYLNQPVLYDLFIIIGYAFVLYIWINLADHSIYWKYNFIL